MARVIGREIDSDTIIDYYPTGKIVAYGILAGVLVWLFGTWASQYMALGLAGNLATIMVGIIMTAVLIWLRVSRPLLVVISVSLVLWGMLEWIRGIDWRLALAFSALLYLISYLLFSWLSRQKNTLILLILTVVVVILMRLVSSL
ncbi:hypothetical protein HGB24_01595 [Candidatus Saccharibacteria bacterium]|nr:hypothetical protein [Candidatus Saccharibacteria bacterium]